MPLADLDDYRWLVSPAAEAYLLDGMEGDASLLQRIARLRRELPAERAALVMEQWELRSRAAEKFSAAADMYFTRKSLEQATDEQVAGFKAQRFARGSLALDLCCGAGGDWLALAQRGPALAVDRDPRLCLLAQANRRLWSDAIAEPSHVLAAEVRDSGLIGELLRATAAWHIDPDRRPAGRRTTRVELHQPNSAVIDALRAVNPHAAVKLAPAAELPAHWNAEAELEWIGRGGQCRQLVAWFGALAERLGTRRASVLSRDGSADCITGNAGIEPELLGRVARYVMEPDAAVLAAGLRGALAEQQRLLAIDMACAYLTADHCPPRSGLLACFEVEEVLPLDLRRLKALLRERRIGRLEVKKRGTQHDPARVQQQLKVAGDEQRTLLITPCAGTVTAVLARRC